MPEPILALPPRRYLKPPALLSYSVVALLGLCIGDVELFFEFWLSLGPAVLGFLRPCALPS